MCRQIAANTARHALHIRQFENKKNSSKNKAHCSVTACHDRYMWPRSVATDEARAVALAAPVCTLSCAASREHVPRFIYSSCTSCQCNTPCLTTARSHAIRLPPRPVCPLQVLHLVCRRPSKFHDSHPDSPTGCRRDSSTSGLVSSLAFLHSAAARSSSASATFYLSSRWQFSHPACYAPELVSYTAQSIADSRHMSRAQCYVLITPACGINLVRHHFAV